MNDNLVYKGFTGSVLWDDKNCVLYGLSHVEDEELYYEGTTMEELVEGFRDSVDFYIDCCKEDEYERGE